MAIQGLVVVNGKAVADLERQPWVAGVLLHVGDQVAAAARVSAPRRTGAGARSIHAEAKLTSDGWEVRVSWDQAHSYMRYPDTGTRLQPAQRFLEDALRRNANVRG